MLADNDRLLDLHLPKDWVRGGAETYIYIFDVVSVRKTQPLILKAYVAPPGTGSLPEGSADSYAAARDARRAWHSCSQTIRDWDRRVGRGVHPRRI